jgi:hypothetical protein
VSWEDAEAYCQWLREKTGDPYRLPTEAEWERAVRGGLEQKKYPWGDDPAVPEGAVADRNAWPPGPPNAFGLSIEYELWEWAADFYHRNYYQESPANDPSGPAEGEFRVLRGGSYPNDPNSMRCSNRGSARPRTALPNVTFRVARDATPQQISELLRPVAASEPPAREVSVPQTLARQPASQPAPAATTPASTRETPAPAPAAESSAPERAAAPPPRPAPLPAPVPAEKSAPAASRPAPAPASGAAVELTRVDATVSSVQVILALSLSGPAQHSTMELTSPDRLVIDLANTKVATARRYGSLSVGDLGVEGVRWAPFEAGTPTARLVVDLMQPVTFSIEAAPSGLVIQLRPR